MAPPWTFYIIALSLNMIGAQSRINLNNKHPIFPHQGLTPVFFLAVISCFQIWC